MAQHPDILTDILTDGHVNSMTDSAQCMYRVTYHGLHVTCLTYHLALMPTATATDPPPANSPTMHGRLSRKTKKPV